jgi:hypothetical protein
MKTFLLHHSPKSANQDTWTVSFSLPYIAAEYAPAGSGAWYVRTWLSADQIKRRLAILFDHPDELGVHELGRTDAALTSRLNWLQGRLDDDEPAAARPSIPRRLVGYPVGYARRRQAARIAFVASPAGGRDALKM